MRVRALVVAAVVCVMFPAVSSSAADNANVIGMTAFYDGTLKDFATMGGVSGPVVAAGTATIEIAWYGCGSSPGQPTAQLSLPVRATEAPHFGFGEFTDRELLGPDFTVDYTLVDQGVVLGKATVTDEDTIGYQAPACGSNEITGNSTGHFLSGKYGSRPQYSSGQTVETSSDDLWEWGLAKGVRYVKLGMHFDPFAARAKVTKKPRVGKKAAVAGATLSESALAAGAQLRYRWYFACPPNGYLSPQRSTRTPTLRVPARVHRVPRTKKAWSSVGCRLTVGVVAKAPGYLELGYEIPVGRVRR